MLKKRGVHTKMPYSGTSHPEFAKTIHWISCSECSKCISRDFYQPISKKERGAKENKQVSGKGGEPENVLGLKKDHFFSGIEPRAPKIKSVSCHSAKKLGLGLR